MNNPSVTSVLQKFRSFFNVPLIPRPLPADFVVDYFGAARVDCIFADIGAGNGVSWNNTLVLELHFKWRGICVEPNPAAAAQLRTLRRAPCFQQFASAQDRRPLRVTAGAGQPNPPASVRAASIPGATVSRMLDAAGLGRVDYLAVQAPSADLQVLRGVDFSRHIPCLISCRNVSQSPAARVFLHAHGYRKIARVQIDDFYIRNRP
jgi:hypothetical protein